MEGAGSNFREEIQEARECPEDMRERHVPGRGTEARPRVGVWRAQ